MDDVLNRLSRELADAMAAAVGDDERVEACHERARASGYHMKVSLEAVIGFASRPREEGLAEVGVAIEAQSVSAPSMMSSNDRRFLRSLRIATGESNQQVD